MIDWLTFVAPLRHSAPINAGHVVSIDPSGAIEWQSSKWSRLEGSHASNLSVRTAACESADPCAFVWIDGNPVKWFQGHNLWGTDDVPSLAVATLFRVCEILGISPHPDDVAQWRAGALRLTRVDVTDSYHLRNRAEVLTWLRAAELAAHLPHRGRGQLTKGSTLYFGKHSRRWSLKLYAKGQEIEAKGHGQGPILDLPSARQWADRTLRAELTLRSLELKRLGLAHVSEWHAFEGVDSSVTARLLRPRLGSLTMTTTARLPADVIESLRPALRVAVQAWEGGSDLRATLPHRTFYKYRKELLPHGIDIAIVNPSDNANVVPLVRILEAVPAQVPDWAIGTPLFFEPTPIRRVA